MIAAALVPKPETKTAAVHGKNTRFVLRPTGGERSWCNNNAGNQETWLNPQTAFCDPVEISHDAERVMLDYTSTGESFWRLKFPHETGGK